MSDLSKYDEQYDRRAELVDKIYLSGLTAQEKEELAELDAQLDKAEDEFYRPIAEGLARLFKKMRDSE